MPLRKARRPAVRRPSPEPRVRGPSPELPRVRRLAFLELRQELDRLERTSPNFPDQLDSLLYSKSPRDTLFRDEDRAELIEYLDKALDTFDPADPTHRKSLGVLEEICDEVETFPESYIFDVSSFVRIAGPIPIGAYEFIYEGSINGLEACAKKLNPFLSIYWRYPRRPPQIVRWKRLTHPNIVHFLGITNEPIHSVWARAPGVELSEYIKNHPDTNQLDLLIDIADGLNYLHFCDIPHGDLGGPNIIVNDSGRPCITEYGLYGVFGCGLTKYRRCMRWADPQLLHPSFEYGWKLESEALNAERKCDIFSFAMVMVEVFTSQAPFFPKPDSVALSALERGERPERPTHVDFTTKLWALVERCWDNYWENRPEISEVLEILRDCRNDARLLIPVLPPASSDWLSQITNEILDLTDQVASVALFGPIGVGKTFVARTVLENDQTKTKFGDNRYFICCDGLENSLESFIQRLSDTIHTDAIQLESHLRSSPPIILLLDSVDFALDPLVPEAEEMFAMIEEFGSYKNVCLVTTSRMYPDIHGFHRVEVPTPTESGARDIFYSLCNLARSPTVDTLIAKLDFHPFSIALFARTIHENSWDEQEMLKMWDDPKGVLKTTYYEMLKNSIEPVFRSPRIKQLGAVARDVLEAIAAYQSGIGEDQLEGIFRGTGGVREVVDVLCGFSLVHRQNGVLKMLSPLQFYFLESMIVYAKTEEVIKWGPDCMAAQGVLPYSIRGPPDYLLSLTTSRSSFCQDTDCVPPRLSSGPPHTTQDRKAPRKREWIRRLPQIVKKRLLALFGRRIAPAILTDIQVDPAGIPPTGLQENPTNIPVIATQDDPPEIPPIAAQEGPTNSSPVATQDDSPDTPPSVAQEVPANSSPVATQDGLPEIPPHVAQEDPTSLSPVAAQEDVAAMPLKISWDQIPPWAGYDIDW